MTSRTRIEQDSLGKINVPVDAYWGVHTERARQNFQISGITLKQYSCLIIGLAQVKKAAAQANAKLGVLSPQKYDAIVKACDEIIAGKLHDQFVVDMIQGGAGTSTNMNANEVIANRAIEIMGAKKGSYDVLSPQDDVNCSQSTNDTYPTAIRIALVAEHYHLMSAMESFVSACDAKSKEFSTVTKLGRTQLQDAVPMTLGQEIGAFATTVREDIERIRESAGFFKEVNLGATAIGTSINVPDGYVEQSIEALSIITGEKIVRAGNLIEATSDVGAFVSFSGVLKRIAIKVSKICNDLRLLSSGPRGGMGEISLPALQAGSSIMPGKVNPVIPEAMNQIAFLVIGNDVTISFAAEGGQLQLNAFEPVIAFRLFNSLRLLTNGLDMLTTKCISGLEANVETCRENVEMSIGLATVLNPLIGYDKSANIAKAALSSGRSVIEVAEEVESGLGGFIQKQLL